MNTLRFSYSNTTFTTPGNWVDVVTDTLKNRIVSVCDGDDYRFGLKVLTEQSEFNGMEKDYEVKGVWNSLDFGARIYYSMLGRWLSLDPLSKNFPSESNYSFAGNSPIYLIDKDGKYKISALFLARYRDKYPMILKYLEEYVHDDIMKSTKILTAFQEIRSSAPTDIVNRYVSFTTEWDSGPYIVFDDAPSLVPGGSECFDISENTIYLNSNYAKEVDLILSSSSTSDEEKQSALLTFTSKLLHVTPHRLDYPDQKIVLNEDLPVEYKKDWIHKDPNVEVGDRFEESVWGCDDYHPTDIYNPTNIRDAGMTEKVIENAKKIGEGRATLPTVPLIR